MKKVLGILGVTLIMAVSFFNMSSVIDANQNVDLASILQNASANSEAEPSYNSKQEWFGSDAYTYRDPYSTKICSVSYRIKLTECYGVGNVSCTPGEEVWDYVDTCN